LQSGLIANGGQPYSDLNQALRVYQKASALWERLCQQNPNVSGFQCDLSKYYDLQGAMQLALGQHAEALLTQQKVRQIREQLVQSNPGVYAHVPELAFTYVTLAKFFEVSDPSAAEKLYRKAVLLQKDAPDVPSHQEFLAAHLIGLGEFLKRQKRPDEAASIVKQAIDIFDKLAVKFPHVGNYKTAPAYWRVEYGGFGPLKDPLASTPEQLKTTPRNAQEFIERGGKNHMSGKFDAAIADYHRAVDLDPENAEYHYRLGHLYIYRADGLRFDNKRGLEHLQKCLELRPAYYQCHSPLATAYFRLGDLQKSKSHVEKFGEQAPKSPETSAELAMMYQRMGDLETALSHVRDGIVLAPSDPLILLRLVGILTAQGELRKSLEAVNKAIEVNTDLQFFAPYEIRGNIYWSLGQHAESLADWDKVLQILPTRYIAYKRRGLAHFHLKNYSNALADFTKGMELNWNDLSSLTWIDPKLVAACPDEDFRTGMFALADRAIVQTDNRAAAYVARASLYAAHQKHPLAEVDYANAIELDQLNPLYFAYLGQYLLSRKKFVEAEPVLRECLTLREKKQPDIWTTFNAKSLLGGALLGQKKYDEAEPLLLTGYEGMKARESSIPIDGKIVTSQKLGDGRS